jgi:hypothetical protein
MNTVVVIVLVVAAVTSIYFAIARGQFSEFTKHFFLKNNSRISLLTTIMGCLLLISVAVIIILLTIWRALLMP